MPGPGNRTTVEPSYPAAVALSPQSTSRLLDAVGIGLVALLGCWVAFAAGSGAGRPLPVLWLLLGLVVAAALARLLVAQRIAVAGPLAVAVTGSLLLSWPGVLRPAGAPTGYANANATLASLGVIAAIAAARSAPPAACRRWLLLAVVLAVCTASTGSLAGVLSLLAGLALLGLSAATRWPGFAIVGGMILVSVTLAVTTAIAVDDRAGGLAERDSVRADLWAGAVELLDETPVRGIGPGEFAEQNPVTDDADLRWAHHGYLQTAAEYGAVGLSLVLALAGWVWARLWYDSQRHAFAASAGGAATTIVGLHGTVDYVWHVPVVMLVLSLLVAGAGAGSIRTEQVWVQ